VPYIILKNLEKSKKKITLFTWHPNAQLVMPREFGGGVVPGLLVPMSDIPNNVE